MPHRPDPAECLAEILAHSLDDLLMALGLTSVRMPALPPHPASTHALCAMASFGNPDLSVSLALLGEPALFHMLRPKPPIEGQLDAADWACELANQAAGRMRNRLADYGLILEARVPELTPAQHLARALSSTPVRLPLVLRIGDSLLEAWLLAGWTPGLALQPNPSRPTRALAEGAVMLF